MLGQLLSAHFMNKSGPIAESAGPFLYMDANTHAQPIWNVHILQQQDAISEN